VAAKLIAFVGKASRPAFLSPEGEGAAVQSKGKVTEVGPYLGLTPRQYQSGESERIGGIGKTNDPLLRSYLYEAAGVLVTRVHRSCPLKMWALRLAKRIGWKRASIALARKNVTSTILVDLPLSSFCSTEKSVVPSARGRRSRRRRWPSSP
jgi:Transposase IS116/IS110/IS902 family